MTIHVLQILFLFTDLNDLLSIDEQLNFYKT